MADTACFACGKPFAGPPRQKRCLGCIEREHFGEPPKCECGCGLPVAYRVPGGWGRWRKGHHLRHGRFLPAAGRGNSRRGTGKRYPFKCEGCGQDTSASKPGRRFCGRTCYARSRIVPGSLTSMGLGRPYVPERVKQAYRRQKAHVFAVEAVIRRKLIKGEQVHHVDGNVTNDDPRNLVLFHCLGCQAAALADPDRMVAYFAPSAHPTP